MMIKEHTSHVCNHLCTDHAGEPWHATLIHLPADFVLPARYRAEDLPDDLYTDESEDNRRILQLYETLSEAADICPEITLAHPATEAPAPDGMGAWVVYWAWDESEGRSIDGW